ncbi:hypothetical protein C7Y72_03855 [Paraconexibacter algicola]|uniref:Uncharacterized protein n=1 Tax=Paraconexibacter algicola TaxID=2133960 RepID=A0A2T4UHX0_9ACTN|nr:hypothetical protein C7Y72_03855 [Paraconexibacter algicola]
MDVCPRFLSYDSAVSVLQRLALLVLALPALAATGCGDDEPVPAGTTVDVVFAADGLQVTPTTVPSGEDVTLRVSAQDGRPHGVTLDGAPTTVRIVVKPGETRQTPAGELPDGTYRVAPDGATEPVPVTVGP